MSQRAYVVFVSVIAAIGGLLFGFDTAIIAGAGRNRPQPARSAAAKTRVKSLACFMMARLPATG